MPCGGGSEILTEPEYIPDIFKIRMEDKHMKRTVKRILLVAMAALLCLGVFAGCAGTKDIKIGAMPADSNISFFQELAKGMEAAGEAFGVTVDIQYTGRDI